MVKNNKIDTSVKTISLELFGPVIFSPRIIATNKAEIGNVTRTTLLAILV
jgi:hypothetical protein